jgi:hypothetical protein
MHTLYRFYAADGSLLYIGITNSIPTRFRDHDHDKPWYGEAVKVTLEHHPDRDTVLVAEKEAIIAERPRYNVQHNRGASPRAAVPRVAGERLWSFRSRRTGYEKVSTLWLYPEIHYASVVDEWPELDGTGQLYEWVRIIKRKYPEQWDADALPIYWCVRRHEANSHGEICEHAPFWDGFGVSQDFLTGYTWPEDTVTGEPLDWFQLPVINSRSLEFAKALGWTPSPFQPTCPLRSIMSSRGGYSELSTRRASRM